MHHFFAYMARMRFIDRWALMRNSYTENIQEHSHQVAILAHALAVLRNEYFGGQVDAGAVAVAALYHDASEILTGDMPTPIKYYNPDIRDAYKQVEAIACRKLTGMLPQRLQDIYAGLLTPADPEVEELVKAADKLSAHIKCLEELKAGNDVKMSSGSPSTLQSALEKGFITRDDLERSAECSKFLAGENCPPLSVALFI